MSYKKITEVKMIRQLDDRGELLHPMLLDSYDPSLDRKESADVFFTGFLKAEHPTAFFHFLVELKSRSTPKAVHEAVSQIGRATERWRRVKNDMEVYPMIVVPYLSEPRLDELYEAQVSGIDLCGNGVITVPERQLLIYRAGNPNLYPESRPVSNPFRGRSSLAARVFFKESVILAAKTDEERAEFGALNELREEIEKAGIDISLSQVSKAVTALKDKRLIGAAGRAIYMLDPDEIMRRLAVYWEPPKGRRVFLRLPHGLDSLSALDQCAGLKWAISGASSVGHYTASAAAGSLKVIVSNLNDARQWIPGEEESVPNFADVEVIESDDPVYYFDNQINDSRIRWASRLQTWIELSNGEARQQDMAQVIYHQILP